MLSWLFRRRRTQLLGMSLSPRWQQWVAANVWHWHVLDPTQRQRLSGLIHLFVNEKNFEGCDGMKVTPQVKVTIAAAACLLLLGFDDSYCFDQVRTILVYPRPTVQRNLRRSDGVVDESKWLSGMAQQGGPIVLSWRDVLMDSRDDQRTSHVVLHEFAHLIDGLDGAMEGVPPLPTERQKERWKEVARHELDDLRRCVRTGDSTCLDPYGAESPAEFFAVATEAFYCNGRLLSIEHPELYELLAELYKVHTAPWFESFPP